MKRYRIGDFARELGVTPDFLKYCEKHGYLTPQTELNGYRYYDFASSAPVIEYMKLRNQGFTAREAKFYSELDIPRLPIAKQYHIADMNSLALKEARLLRQLADEKERYTA